jgi:hypothetical protein
MTGKVIFISIQLEATFIVHQPYGSLLVVKRARWYWRLSPISSTFEAFIITSCLIFGWSTDTKESTTGSTWTSLTQSGGWRTTSAALLLLRSGKYNSTQAVDVESIKRDLSAEHNWTLQIWAIVTVIFLFLKLCVVRGAPWFTFLGLSYALAWFSVQTLLLMAYRKRFTQSELTEIRFHFEGFSEAASSWSWTSFYAAPWGIASFLLLFGLSFWGIYGSDTGRHILFVFELITLILSPQLDAGKNSRRSPSQLTWR